MARFLGLASGFFFIVVGGLLIAAEPIHAPSLTAELSPAPPGEEKPIPPSRQSIEEKTFGRLFYIHDAPSTKGMLFTPDGKELWVTLLLNTKTGVKVFDTETGKKLNDIALGGGGGVEIIFSRDGSRAYVSQMESASVFEIDTSTKKVLRSFKTQSSWTKVLALSPDSKTLYASNWLGNDISEIDLASGKLVRKIPTVKTPRGLYATPDGKYLYVAGFENGDIEKINLETLEKKIIFKTGGAMRHFAADDVHNILFVSDMGKNTIWKVNMSTDTVTKFADTENNPNTIVLSRDKKMLFVSNRGKNFSEDNYYKPGLEWGTVQMFNAETGELLDVIIGGNQPTALDVSPDGSRLAFSDFLDAKIEMFSLPTTTELLKPNLDHIKTYKSEIQKK